MQLIYHPEAQAELIDAARFYEQQVNQLGSQFLDSVDLAITVIQQAPLRWAIIEADVRRYLIPRFPYSVYYRAFSDEIRILAIKHHSRHPDYWRDRLAE